MHILVALVLYFFLSFQHVASFVPTFFSRRSSHVISTRASSTGTPAVIEEETIPEIIMENILLSGFVSKEYGFSDTDIFDKVFSGGAKAPEGTGSGKMFIPGEDSTRQLTAHSDDIPFAKKRLVSPKSVYSGLIDSLKFSSGPVDEALNGQDAWVAFNVTTSEVMSNAEKAVAAKLKRVVFAVYVDECERRTPNMDFKDACEKMDAAGVKYTIIKYGDLQKMLEAKFPYRVVRGALELPLPEGSTAPALSSGNLFRIISEVLDIPKTYGCTYGVGPGTKVDSEILVYMKSQGWPERVQVGLLVGDMMEKIEKMYEEEAQKKIGQYEAAKVEGKALKSGSYEDIDYLGKI